MRRLIAILLFAAFMLPFALPALALGQDADVSLPACCRRTGAHHCAMGMGERTQFLSQDSKTPHWQHPLARCPYAPASLVSSHPVSLAPPPAHASALAFFAHPAGVAQTESKRRLARDRSRQKRGPPAVSLL